MTKGNSLAGSLTVLEGSYIIVMEGEHVSGWQSAGKVPERCSLVHRQQEDGGGKRGGISNPLPLECWITGVLQARALNDLSFILLSQGLRV